LPSGANKESDFKLAQQLVDHGMFLHPGEEHSEEPGWFRLVFGSLLEDEFIEGLRNCGVSLNLQRIYLGLKQIDKCGAFTVRKIKKHVICLVFIF